MQSTLERTTQQRSTNIDRTDAPRTRRRPTLLRRRQIEERKCFSGSLMTYDLEESMSNVEEVRPSLASYSNVEILIVLLQNSSASLPTHYIDLWQECTIASFVFTHLTHIRSRCGALIVYINIWILRAMSFVGNPMLVYVRRRSIMSEFSWLWHSALGTVQTFELLLWRATNVFPNLHKFTQWIYPILYFEHTNNLKYMQLK
jgi:hypothetical protein